MGQGDDRVSDDRALGRLEGRVDSLSERMVAVEGGIGTINGKLDAIQTTLAGQAGGWSFLSRGIGLLVGASGWVAMAVTKWGGH